jgi:hypothetical protein
MKEPGKAAFTAFGLLGQVTRNLSTVRLIGMGQALTTYRGEVRAGKEIYQRHVADVNWYQVRVNFAVVHEMTLTTSGPVLLEKSYWVLTKHAACCTNYHLWVDGWFT